ncbi:uncharacterized protein SPSK_02078 [Sporothrix schenckii 1099-18]|uniref:Uncharacterized protein n=1 Tax=Sporothrix schenckii 1099-18 TaxID=1397361 RepID=A0A0F2MEE6_SPOSC|nr:uncharacterized protein SPSK_02078 [Sporothrix schenckii 1099-18]KJR87449.1 hypothetical protein SPSK_02078 [Sporothrix schenckii 1099-18]
MLAGSLLTLLLATLVAARVQPRETPSAQNPHPVRALVDRSTEPACEDLTARVCVSKPLLPPLYRTFAVPAGQVPSNTTQVLQRERVLGRRLLW